MSKENSYTPRTALAIGCHPDDIEFMMAGTLFLLKGQNISLHYLNIANGNCGTLEYNREEIEVIRRKEAQTAAAYLGATWYPSFTNDLEVVYDLDIVRKTAAVIRQVAPDIILIPALLDYMEDHMNTARIAVTAAFTINMPNFYTIPQVDPIRKEVALYHALPYGLHDGLSRKVEAQLYTDISSVIDHKEHMLSCHVSQRNWLDDSQKLDSYVQTMRDMSQQVGNDSGHYSYAEGWIRHNPLGYSMPNYKPLEQVLHAYVLPAKPTF
ncbi:MAG: PIG-L family deacetylase [Sphaerochaetaceae bacterium]|jgi:LmbE family N-acetylglucosaminyl deacetylase|nr:PIG-L family deacetylase [Sphaerochaetaceae bacterium]MDD4218573.1 PIG-L family deacetylase [Sphaerochaetaceae bacterium]